MENYELKQLWLIDIDGTICEDIPNEKSELFSSAQPIEGALEMVLELEKEGGRITYFTARTSEHAEVTETWLKKHGFPFESVCYNKPRINKGEQYHWVDNKSVTSSFVPYGIQTL